MSRPKTLFNNMCLEKPPLTEIEEDNYSEDLFSASPTKSGKEHMFEKQFSTEDCCSPDLFDDSL